MTNSIIDNMDLFYIDNKNNLVNWMFIDNNPEGEQVFCNYKYTFEEFKDLAEAYHVSDLFFEKLLESGEHIVVKESEPEFADSIRFFNEGSYDFEGQTRETMDGILKHIKQYEQTLTVALFRILTPDEQKYTFDQPSKLELKTGSIAHIRADFGTLGNNFFTLYDDHNSIIAKYFNEFKTEFDDVINKLRYNESFGGLLYNRGNMKDYCSKHKAASFTADNTEYFGFRIDTEHFAYLLRCNPTVGEYNLYCYAYDKNILNQHLTNARKGISFKRKDLKEKFHINDGDKIRIVLFDGGFRDHVCRYYDDNHIIIKDNAYNIDELVHRCEIEGHIIEPVKSSLSTMIKSASKSRECKEEPDRSDLRSKYFYKFDDVEEVKKKYFITEGYACLKRVKLYPEKEYEQLSDQEKDGMWGVYMPGTFSHEFADFDSLKDAYAALRENEAQTDFEREHDL